MTVSLGIFCFRRGERRHQALHLLGRRVERELDELEEQLHHALLEAVVGVLVVVEVLVEDVLQEQVPDLLARLERRRAVREVAPRVREVRTDLLDARVRVDVGRADDAHDRRLEVVRQVPVLHHGDAVHERELLDDHPDGEVVAVEAELGGEVELGHEVVAHERAALLLGEVLAHGALVAVDRLDRDLLRAPEARHGPRLQVLVLRLPGEEERGQRLVQQLGALDVRHQVGRRLGEARLRAQRPAPGLARRAARPEAAVQFGAALHPVLDDAALVAVDAGPGAPIQFRRLRRAHCH